MPINSASIPALLIARKLKKRRADGGAIGWEDAISSVSKSLPPAQIFAPSARGSDIPVPSIRTEGRNTVGSIGAPVAGGELSVYGSHGPYERGAGVTYRRNFESGGAALDVARDVRRKKRAEGGGVTDGLRRVYVGQGGDDNADADQNIQPSYDPMSGVQIGGEMSPEPAPDQQGTFSRMMSRLTGTQFGEPRQQLWPEKMVRSGVSLARDKMREGMLPPGLRREDYTDAPPPQGPTDDSTWLGRQIGAAPVQAQPQDPDYERVQDMAGLAGGQTLLTAGGREAAGAAAAGAGRDFRVMGRQVLVADSQATGAPVAALEHAPQFHTSIEPALANTARQSGTGTQWLNDMKRYGAKPEEMDWRGVTQLVSEKANAPISRAEIESHLGGNKVELKPVDLNSMPENFKDLTPEQNGLVAQRYEEINGGPLRDLPDWYENIASSSGESALDKIFNPARWSEYQLPGGKNYRERVLTLPTKVGPKEAEALDLTKRMGAGEFNHLDEAGRAEFFDRLQNLNKEMNAEKAKPYEHAHWSGIKNPVVHRRSNERMMDIPFTPDEAVAAEAHRAAGAQLEALRQQQGEMGRQIRTAAKPAKVVADYNAGKMSHYDMIRKTLEDVVEHPELAPLQDKLQALRAQEDALRKSLGPEPKPKQARTLHAEEIQSDLHQTGAKEGYKSNHTAQYERMKNDLLKKYEVDSYPQALKKATAEEKSAMDSITEKAIMEQENPNREKLVPDAPFKNSWHRLALHDMLREAAEKNFDRISWTAGDSQATHPKNLGASQRAIEDAEKGMRAFYDDKMVNAANKIGKAHGVSVKKGTIADTGAMSGEQAMNRMGIPLHEQEAFWNNLIVEQGSQALEDFFKAARDKGHDIWYMDVPQSLKDQALKKGFSLFEDGATAGAPLAASQNDNDLVAAIRAEQESEANKKKRQRPVVAMPERKDGGVVINPAMDIARRIKRAKGGKVHVGPIVGDTGGRADKVPMEVPDGAYVLTSDHCSSMGEGNTLAGFEKLKGMFPKSKPSAMRNMPGKPIPILAADGEWIIAPQDIIDRWGDLETGHKILDHWQTSSRQQHIETLKGLDPPAQD